MRCSAPADFCEILRIELCFYVYTNFCSSIKELIPVEPPLELLVKNNLVTRHGAISPDVYYLFDKESCIFQREMTGGLVNEMEAQMKKVFGLYCILAVVLMSGNDAPAASGKCTVVEVDGSKMVVDCPPVPKGFVKGSKIKIKSDKDKPREGN